MRYTRQNLRDDIVGLNLKIAKLCDRQLVVEGRNGYTAVDITKQIVTFPRGGCVYKTSHENMLAAGTPRECLASVHKFIVELIPN